MCSSIYHYTMFRWFWGCYEHIELLKKSGENSLRKMYFYWLCLWNTIRFVHHFDYILAFLICSSYKKLFSDNSGGAWRTIQITLLRRHMGTLWSIANVVQHSRGHYDYYSSGSTLWHLELRKVIRKEDCEYYKIIRCWMRTLWLRSITNHGWLSALCLYPEWKVIRCYFWTWMGANVRIVEKTGKSVWIFSHIGTAIA